MKSTKTMLIAALAVGALLACSSALRADDTTNAPPSTPPPGAPPGDNHGTWTRGRPDFVKALNLTDDQKPKFKTIMDAQMQQMREVRDDDSLSQDDKRAKMKSIHEATATQMQALLTPDQFAKWQKMSQHRPRHPMQDGDNPPPANPPADAPPQN